MTGVVKGRCKNWTELNWPDLTCLTNLKFNQDPELSGYMWLFRGFGPTNQRKDGDKWHQSFTETKVIVKQVGEMSRPGEYSNFIHKYSISFIENSLQPECCDRFEGFLFLLKILGPSWGGMYLLEKLSSFLCCLAVNSLIKFSRAATLFVGNKPQLCFTFVAGGYYVVRLNWV